MIKHEKIINNSSWSCKDSHKIIQEHFNNFKTQQIFNGETIIEIQFILINYLLIQ